MDDGSLTAGEWVCEIQEESTNAFRITWNHAPEPECQQQTSVALVPPCTSALLTSSLSPSEAFGTLYPQALNSAPRGQSNTTPVIRSANHSNASALSRTHCIWCCYIHPKRPKASENQPPRTNPARNLPVLISAPTTELAAPSTKGEKAPFRRSFIRVAPASSLAVFISADSSKRHCFHVHRDQGSPPPRRLPSSLDYWYLLSA